MTRIAVELTGDEADLLRSLRRSDAQVDKLKRALAEARREGRRAGRETGRAFGGQALANLKGFATGLVGIGTAAAGVTAAVRLLNSELQNQRELQGKARGAALTVEQSRQLITANLFGQDEGTIRKALQTGADISERTGIRENIVNQALASALSASAQDLSASAKAVEDAAVASRADPESIPLLAGASLDLAKLTGTTDAAVNRGLLRFAASLGRVVNPQQQAANIPGALIGAQNFGATVSGAVALNAALSSAAVDPEGRRTRTAQIAIGQQTRAFFRELRDSSSLQQQVTETQERFAQRIKEIQDEDLPGAGITPRSRAERQRIDERRQKELADREKRLSDVRAERDAELGPLLKRLEQRQGIADQLGERQLSTIERIQFLQERPELARQFVEGPLFSIEKAMEGVAEQLFLQPGAEVNRLLQDNLTKVDVTNNQLAELARQEIQNQQTSKTFSTAELDRRLGNLTDQLDVRNQQAATAGVIRERLFPILQRAGLSSIGQSLASLQFEAGTRGGTQNVVTAATGLLRDRLRDLQFEETVVVPDGGAFGRGVGGPGFVPQTRRVPRQLEGQEKLQVEALQKSIQILSEAATKLNEAADKQVRAAGGGDGLVQPQEDR